MFAHCGSRGRRITSANGPVDLSMHVGGVFEIACLIQGLSSPLVENLRNHFHNRRQNRISRGSRHRTVKTKVMEEVFWWILKRCVSLGHFFCEFAEVCVRRLLRRQAGYRYFDDTSGLKDLFGRKSVQGSEHF